MPLATNILRRVPWHMFVKTIILSLPFGEHLFRFGQVFVDVQQSTLWQSVSTIVQPNRHAVSDISQPKPGLLSGLLSPFTSFIFRPFRALSFLLLVVFLSLSSITSIMIFLGIAFHPICDGTGISTSQFCRVVVTARQMTLPSSAYPFYPSLFDNSTQVLDGVVGGSAIITTASDDLSKAYIAIDDLILLVQNSSLSRKDAFLSSLEMLSTEARETGFRLQNFAAFLDGSIDVIVFANRHVHQGLDESSKSGLSSAVHDRVCTSMGLMNFPTVCPSSATFETERRYRHALVTFEDELKELTVRAHTLLGCLDRLDTRLRTILFLSKAEEADVIEAREIVQSQILTVFGFNKKQLAEFAEAISIVAQVTEYTGMARNHVYVSHSRLFKLQEEVIEARRTTAAGLKADWVPITESAILIANGIERLQVAQARARARGEVDGLSSMA